MFWRFVLNTGKSDNARLSFCPNCRPLRGVQDDSRSEADGFLHKKQ